MKYIRPIQFLLIFLALSGCLYAQAWSGILAPTYGTGACTFLTTSTYAGCGVDWTRVGIPNGIPSGSWTQSGSTITGSTTFPPSTDQTSTIQNALNSCGTNHFVLLGGTPASPQYFLIDGNIGIPSNCVLRGGGANASILYWEGTSGDPIYMGYDGAVDGYLSTSNVTPVSVSSGATAGSTSLTLSSTSGMSSGQLLAISELNNPSYVDIGSSQSVAACTYCYIVYNWGDGNGSARTRGEITQITNISSNTVTLADPLTSSYSNTLPGWSANTYYGYLAYITNGGYYYEQQESNTSGTGHCLSGSTQPSFPTSSGTVSDGPGTTSPACVWAYMGSGTSTQPQVAVFSPLVTNAGVENLQVYDNNTFATVDILMTATMECWIYGVEVNYTSGDFAEDANGYRNQIANNYFSNSYSHGPGAYDAGTLIDYGTSGNLFINNICERGHVGCVMYERGGARNVDAYNYAEGSFDDNDYWDIEAVNYHGAHPTFVLHEGNVYNRLYGDTIHGTSSHSTTFRNWWTGTTLICSPTGETVSRSTVTCSPTGYPGQSGTDSWYEFQQASGIELSYGNTYFNFIGDVIGSSQAQSLEGFSGSALSQADRLLWNSGANRAYGAAFDGEVMGFGDSSDTGSFALDSTMAATTSLFHGIYQNVDGSTTWQSGLPTTLPNSFFLSSKPSWWTSGIPWPAIGPDVTGGTGPGGHTSLTASNPAQNCYLNVMGGVDGGAGSPLTFNAATCYAAPPPAPPTAVAAVGH
jgi:hypothetical protein